MVLFIWIKDSESQIVINDFRNLIYYYLRWKGEKIIECEKCNILTKPKNNRQKYCDKCWKEVNKEQIKERVKKYRNVTV